MLYLRFSDITPAKLAYYGLRFSGAFNREGRPWSLLLAGYNLVMLSGLGFTSGMELLFGSGVLIDVVQTVSILTAYLHIKSKTIKMLSNQTEIMKLLKRLEEVRQALLKDEFGTHLLTPEETFGMKFALLYSFGYVSFPLVSVIIGFILDYVTESDEPHLIEKVWIPWSMKEFWPYVMGMMFSMLSVLSSVIFYASSSILEITITFEISGFLKVLQFRLENNGPKDKLIYEYHQALISLLLKYNNLFSGPLYFEIFVSSLQPCGFGYALIKTMKTLDLGILDLIYKLSMCMVAPFLICACGQKLLTEMEKLHESSYMNNWYEEKPEVRRDLLTMMIVTTKPIEMNYKRTVSFNYPTFTKVMQGVYSYLMMIINFEID